MKFTKADNKTPIEKEVNRLLDEMRCHDASSKEYKAMAHNVETLMKAESYNKNNAKVSPDAILAVAGNLLGILLILGYEHGHVITSKALGFVLKGRV